VKLKDREFVCPFAFSDPIYDTEELKKSRYRNTGRRFENFNLI